MSTKMFCDSCGNEYDPTRLGPFRVGVLTNNFLKKAMPKETIYLKRKGITGNEKPMVVHVLVESDPNFDACPGCLAVALVKALS